MGWSSTVFCGCFFASWWQEAHRVVIPLGAGEHGARERRVFAVQHARGKQRAVLHFLAVVDWLGEHDQVFSGCRRAGCARSGWDRPGRRRNTPRPRCARAGNRSEWRRWRAAWCSAGRAGRRPDIPPRRCARWSRLRECGRYTGGKCPSQRGSARSGWWRTRTPPQRSTGRAAVARAEVALVASVAAQDLDIASALAGHIGDRVSNTGGNAIT